MIRLSTFILLGLIALASGVLFHISYEVQSLEDELTGLNRQITHQQDSIRVLHAEWAYLNQPSRLRTLADRLSTLEPVSPDQLILAAAELPLPLPGADRTPAVIAAVAGQAVPPTLVSLPLPLRKPGTVVTAAPAAAQAVVPATGAASAEAPAATTVTAAAASPVATAPAATAPATAAVAPAATIRAAATPAQAAAPVTPLRAAPAAAPPRAAAPATAGRAPAQAVAQRAPAMVPTRAPVATVPAAARTPAPTARTPAPVPAGTDPIALLLVNLRAQESAQSAGANR